MELCVNEVPTRHHKKEKLYILSMESLFDLTLSPNFLTGIRYYPCKQVPDVVVPLPQHGSSRTLFLLKIILSKFTMEGKVLLIPPVIFVFNFLPNIRIISGPRISFCWAISAVLSIGWTILDLLVCI